jgi:hypothetical protein
MSFGSCLPSRRYAIFARRARMYVSNHALSLDPTQVSISRDNRLQQTFTGNSTLLQEREALGASVLKGMVAEEGFEPPT